MSLRFRQLRLRAETGGGAYGAKIVFSEGLNILWADNTMGKSTMLQAILYVLGLERMLSPRREVPLTYVMTSHLVDAESGVEHKVHESSVTIELSNSEGQVITVRRAVVGADRKLVSVFHGPMLSEPDGTYRQTDYFVLDPGAAQREAGFHRFLAQFVGWVLPTVRRFDGTETPLYLETIFPLLYVEQKSGWSSIPAAFPTYLQIRDVSKRSVEFILGLDTHEVELQRQQIDIDTNELRLAWSAKTQELAAAARPLNARVSGLPALPVISIDDLGAMSLEVRHNGVWVTLASVLQDLHATVSRLQDTPVPTVEEVGPEAAAALERSTVAVDDLNARRVALLRRYRTESSQVSAADRRIETLEEDLQKNLDVLKLRKLGSTLTATAFSVEHCPTCDQPIRDSLLPQSEVGDVMPIEDNVEYIRTQLSMFKQVAVQSRTAMLELVAELRAVTSEFRDASARLRAVKTDLTAPDRTPSVSAITERIQTENRLASFATLAEQFEAEKEAFRELGKRARQLAEDRAGLPSERFTSSDKAKLAKLTQLVRLQAEEYGFTTFDPTEISISEDTYRPEKEGFEIGFQLSASDAIRLKWAYQLALLELGQTHATNHPGFLIFDEPRQQEARKLSFQRLLEHAAKSLDANHQVIFATSEDLDQLRGFVSGLKCHLVEFDGKIMKRL